MRLNKKSTLCTVVVLGAVAWCSVSGQESAPKALAGLISELSGEASVTLKPGAKAGKVQRFDALGLGATIATGPKSRAVIVLAGGQRFELRANAKATIAAKDLAAKSGPIIALPSLPPLPKLAALDESGPKGPAGGIRLRDTAISGLRPSGIVTLPERTVLHFNQVRGASRYSIAIETEAGTRIFAIESTSSEIIVPAGLLEPQATYYWTVQTLDKIGAAARGATEFRTLSAENGRLRAALSGSLGSDKDENALALLAEVDRRLGLYQEALDGFRAALARAPDDVALQEAVNRLQSLLEKG